MSVGEPVVAVAAASEVVEWASASVPELVPVSAQASGPALV